MKDESRLVRAARRVSPDRVERIVKVLAAVLIGYSLCYVVHGVESRESISAMIRAACFAAPPPR